MAESESHLHVHCTSASGRAESACLVLHVQGGREALHVWDRPQGTGPLYLEVVLRMFWLTCVLMCVLVQPPYVLWKSVVCKSVSAYAGVRIQGPVKG